MASLDFRTEKFNFKKYYNVHYPKLKNALNAYLFIVSSVLEEAGIETHTITGRIKNREESVRKFTRKYQDKLEAGQTPYEIKNYINDLIGLRIVLLYETDIDKVGELLQQEFTVLDKTDKSRQLAETENAFGYKGLHLDLTFSEARAAMREYSPYLDFSFEVQIRTIIQDAWSVLDHKIKYKKAIPSYLERRINSLAALFEIADQEFLNIHLANQEEEEKARTQSPSQENINAFSFARILEQTMPQLQADKTHIPEMVDHILSFGDLGYKELKEMITQNMDIVSQFITEIQSKLGRNFHPDAFVYIPHILYRANPEKYKGILPGFSKTAFSEWLNKQEQKTDLVKSEAEKTA